MNINYVLDTQFDDGSESDATVEPFDVEVAKGWGKIDVSDDDSIIETLITTARQQCEDFLNISLIARTVTAYLDNSAGNIRLPYGPVKEIVSITDDSKDLNDIDEDNYELKGLLFKTLSSPSNCHVIISYTAGYDILPEHFKTAVKQQILYLYENRGDAKLMEQLSPIVAVTLKPYRRVV